MGSYLYFYTKEENENLFKYEKYKNPYYISSPYSSINLNSSFLIKQTYEDFNKNYSQIDIIERNSISKITLLSNKKTRINKVLKSSKIKNEEYYQDCLKEIESLKYLDHPNIIKIYKYQIIENKNIDILIEYLKGPNLFSKLSQINHFNEKDTLIIMYQLFSCIKMIHDNGIVHRDIKPENIIIINEKNLLIKLIDFGSCEIFSEIKKESNRRIGTPSYSSPEIINGENYGYECDIWAMGVLMYFLLSGKLPFDGINPNDIFNSVKNKKISFDNAIWNDISLDAKNLIKCLLIKDKGKRININQVLEYSWVINGLIKYNIKNNFHNKDFCVNVIKNNIIKFFDSKINQLQLLFLFYIIHNYIDLNNNNEIIFIKNEFLYYDKDNDGKLSGKEINNLLNDNDINEENIKIILDKIFILFGKNRGKYIFYEDFIVITLSNKNKYFKNNQIIIKFFEFITKRDFSVENINENIIKVEDIKKLIFDKNEDKYSKEAFADLLENIEIKDKNFLSFEKFKNSLLELNI